MTAGDPVFAALLNSIGARPLDNPNAEMMSIAGSLTSEPLAAFARAIASNAWEPDFGRFEVGVDRMDEDGYYDELIEFLEPLGLEDAEGLCIGTTGGGEEALYMIADEGKPEGYLICRFAYDGMPYDNGDPLEPIGQFEQLLRLLAADGELHPELSEVLSAAGGPAPEAPPEPEPSVPDGAIVLRRVDEPIEFTDEARQKHYGGVYDDERIVNAIKLAFVSSEGRVGASVSGYPAGAHMNHMLLTDDGGQLLMKVEDPGSSWCAWYTAHPTDERALMGDGADLIEVDLRTQEKTRIGPRPARATYLVLDGRERILTLDQPTETVRVFAYEPGTALADEPLFEHKLPPRQGANFAPFGHDAFLLPVVTDDGLTYELARLSEPTEGAIELRNEGRLVTAPEVYANRWFTNTRGGVHHILVADGWYVL